MRYKTFQPFVTEAVALIVAAAVVWGYQLFTGKALYHEGMLSSVPRWIDVIVMPLCAHLLWRVQNDQAKHDINTAWTFWFFGFFFFFGALYGSIIGIIFAVITLLVGYCIKWAEMEDRSSFKQL